MTVVIEKSGLTDQTLSVLLSTVNGTATGQYKVANLGKCIETQGWWKHILVGVEVDVH